MSYASLLLVKEFFTQHGFLVLQYEDVLLVKNSLPAGSKEENYVMELQDVLRLDRAIIKPVAWHTLKFVPSVLKESPEIFRFLKGNYLAAAGKVFGGESFARILVIPGLPASDRLRAESISYLKEKSIDGVICFPALLSALIKKINPRRVYLSQTNEILRILKYYGFFQEEQQLLPFEEK